MKVCTKCKVEKSLDDFHNHKSRKDGKHPWCKLCVKGAAADQWKRRSPELKQQQKDRRKASIAKLRSFVKELKESTPCADCGHHFPAVCMDFDHLPGFVKEWEISDLIGTNRPNKLREEIQKCELVCANCHRIRTDQRNVGSWATP